MNKIKEYDSQIEFVKNEDEFLNSSDNETALITLKQTEVCYGADDSCNVEYCKENNIPSVLIEPYYDPNVVFCIVGAVVANDVILITEVHELKV